MPFFIALGMFLFAVLYTAEFIDKKLKLFYKTYTPQEVHLVGIFIFLLVSYYFLKPIYQKLSGKINEKNRLKQLQYELSQNRKASDMNYIWSNSPDVNLRPKPLPYVIKKIALITSKNSAGHIDFNNTIQCGEVIIYNTVMNEDTPHTVIESIIENIEICNLNNTEDIICITRGGGSYLSEIFDSELLVNTIVNSAIPVLIGTGHATDCSLCDKVCDNPINENNKKYYFITPTALAQFLNEYNEKQLKNTSDLLKKMHAISDSISINRLLCYFIIIYILYHIFYI